VTVIELCNVYCSSLLCMWILNQIDHDDDDDDAEHYCDTAEIHCIYDGW